MNVTRDSDEVTVVFNTYIVDSRKNRTRQKGKRNGKVVIQCSIESEMRPVFGTSHSVDFSHMIKRRQI